MGLKIWIAVAIAGVSVLYMMDREPDLTPKLLEWRKGGQFMQYKGYDIFYRVEAGRYKDKGTLLCLHGFPTSSYDWTKILEDLKDQFSQIILYDYIGFGLSDKPKYHAYSIMEQADIGESVLSLLGVKKVHLLAHDYGDTVALELLARYNNKEDVDRTPVIQSLCLTNGGIFPETNFPRPVQKILLYPYIGPVVSRLTNFLMFSRGFGEIFGPESKPSKEELWDFYVLNVHKGGHIISYRLIQYITERTKYKDRWVGALKNTNVTVHMIYGPSDPVNPDSFIDFYKKTVPQHGISVLDSKIGHYPQWEAPIEFLNAYSDFTERILSHTEH